MVHVAACSGVIKGYDAKNENAEISSIPHALVLFNPVIDTTDKGYGSDKFTRKPKPTMCARACHPPISCMARSTGQCR